MSRVVIGQSGAAIVGIPLLTFVAGLSSWRLAFFTLAGLALLAVALAWRVLPTDPREAGGRFGVEQVLAGLVALAMVATGAYTIGNAMVLTAETPAGRATTMTLNSSALSLGVALGGAFGGLALVVGGYQALGVCAPICSAAAAAIIWSARTRDLPLSSPLG